jgi:hypothetical protein
MTQTLSRPNHAFRSSQRVTITLPHSTFEALVDRSGYEGRSLSNLAAFLLETVLSPQAKP